jgi:DNA-binding MarR family transcriptional regulator
MPRRKSTPAEHEHTTFQPEPAYLDTLKKLRIVIRAAQRHSAWIEKQCGVSGAQLWIMQELQDTPGLRVGEIANRLAIHQTTVSNLLESLEKRQYVVKKRDPKDQRAVQLELSAEGNALLLHAPKPARGLLPEALRHLGERELAMLNEGLQGLLDSIGQMDEAYGMQPLPFSM